MNKDSTQNESEHNTDRGIPSINQTPPFIKKHGLLLVVAAGLSIFGMNMYAKFSPAESAQVNEDKYYGTGVEALPQHHEHAGNTPGDYKRNPPREKQGDTINNYYNTFEDNTSYNQSNNNPRKQRDELSDLPARTQPQRPDRSINNAPTAFEMPADQKAREKKEQDKWARRQAGVLAYEAGASRPVSQGFGNNPEQVGGMPDINRELAALEQLTGNLRGERSTPDISSLMGSPQSQTTNPNQTFAESVQSQIVETATAMPMGDLEHKIVQGKLIPCTLETAIDSSLPGMVRCVVSKDVYGEAGRSVLVPRGARVVGQYNSAIQNGQYRIFVVWSRIITGTYDIAIGSPSTDNLGRAGSVGDVDSHFWDRVGNATLLSVLGAGAATYGNQDQGFTASNAYRQSLANSFGSQSNQSLQQNMNIPDTIHIDQGEKVKIMAAKDLDFNIVMKSQMSAR